MNEYHHTRETYNKIAKKYDARASIRGLDIRFAELFRQKLKGTSVLDVGCADGKYAEYFVDSNLNVTGIDFSDEMINLARKRVPSASFLVMNILELSLAQTFDGVWAAASLLHIKKVDFEKVIKLIYNIVKANGLFYFSLIEGNETKFVKASAGIEGERLFVYYSKEELRNTLESVGFSDIEILEVNYLDNKIWLHVFAMKS